MNAAAIILAAGESRRMGRPKALLPFRGGTFLSVLAGALGSYCSPVVAVFGFDGETVASAAPANVISVINPDYQLGMLTSLQTGLRALGDSLPERVLFTLVDHPAVAPETIAAVMAADADIAIPRKAGRRGHPVIVSRAIALEYLREPATSKVRDVIDRHAGRIRYIEVEDPAISDDVDDPALYEALLAREASRT
ncbi:MAG TPA: NTP transferase domain-containing protein [Bryobacteraceae bacterium]|nr:NTP transferase domain-containing protein [Bryobacteraceae bacterium]